MSTFLEIQGALQGAPSGETEHHVKRGD